jgi:hypothetical protein
MHDVGNIILHQIISDEEKLSIQEVKPILPDSSIARSLIFSEKTLQWAPYYDFKGSPQIVLQNKNGIISIDASVDTRAIIDDKIKGTNIHYKDDRIGIGRGPMYSYKFDIAVPENTLMTAFHVGDGKYGFSMGNGTAQGFIPEIIGMGSDENDAGLYFIGRAGNDIPSTIPLVIIDGRNHLHKRVENRPLFGITNAQYDEYKLLVDQNGLVGIGKIPQIYKLEVKGAIKAADFILDSSISITELMQIIIEQKTEIDILKNRITTLENSAK